MQKTFISGIRSTSAVTLTNSIKKTLIPNLAIILQNFQNFYLFEKCLATVHYWNQKCDSCEIEHLEFKIFEYPNYLFFHIEQKKCENFFEYQKLMQHAGLLCLVYSKI